MGDPQRESDQSGDEELGTVEEEDTDKSDSERETVTVAGVHYEVRESKRRRQGTEELPEAGTALASIEMGERVMASGLVRWQRIEDLSFR